MGEWKHTNALINETSPYLLQHAHNPVDWYPWGETALQKSKSEDKPILLSIGYSACHWCHVMERESFEREDIAALMNESFINIKVDREERPDLDAIYMQAVMMLTGHGGWPMTVFLTPNLEPFFGGTYFPPEDRQSMIGFPRLLRSIAQAYRDRRDDLRLDADSIKSALQRGRRMPHSPGKLTTEILTEAASNLLLNFDEQNGGFGSAPKFPPAMALDFLMRSYWRTGTRRFLDAVILSLERMASGGIYDHLGGGFHRYAVDGRWRVPHFEKMLYDNALLSRAYLNGFLLTGCVLCRRTAEETLDYVLHEMTSPEGGFYSSQDADSEGEEGKFYTWDRREVQDLLGNDEAELFIRYFGITDEGELDGRNVLYIPRSASLVARLNNVSEERVRQVVERGRGLLSVARERRIKPHRDEKSLVSWNGMMLRSFAEAAQALDRDDYRAAAVRCAEFLISRCKKDEKLFHSYKDGRATISAFLDDYALSADGLLSLYEATFDTRWLHEANGLVSVMLRQFEDGLEPGFFMSSRDQEQPIYRPKELIDNATPSGNSAAAYVLLRLARFTGDDTWSAPVVRLLEAMSQALSQNPAAYANMLCALDLALHGSTEIAVVGNPQQESTKVLLRQVFRCYLPDKVVCCGLEPEPYPLKGKSQVSGIPTAYVCRYNVCDAPVTGKVQLELALQSPRRV